MRSSFPCDRPGTRTQNRLIKSQLLCQIELVGPLRGKLYRKEKGCQQGLPRTFVHCILKRKTRLEMDDA